MLARSVPDTPPEEIVAEVTPWRRADIHREHHPLGRADEYRPLRRLFPAAAWGALPRLCRLLHHRGARRQYSQQRGVLHAPADLWLQYPVVTAMEKRLTAAWGDTGAFRTVQHALQFFPEDAQTLR